MHWWQRDSNPLALDHKYVVVCKVWVRAKDRFISIQQPTRAAKESIGDKYPLMTMTLIIQCIHRPSGASHTLFRVAFVINTIKSFGFKGMPMPTHLNIPCARHQDVITSPLYFLTLIIGVYPLYTWFTSHGNDSTTTGCMWNQYCSLSCWEGQVLK